MAANPPLSAHLRLRGLWVVVGWLLVLLVVYESLTPAPIRMDFEQGDKLGHALAYLILMSWFANLYEIPAQRIAFAVGFAFLGISLEFIQRWTGYRSFELADMAAGTVGVVIGWILAPPRTPNYLVVAEEFWRNHS